MQGSVLPEEFENPGTIPHSRFPDPPFAIYDKLPCLSPVPSSLAQHLNRKVPRDARDTHRTVGRAALLVGGLVETVHQFTQVVASIAKSCPEHYANISSFARRLCLADLGKVVKS
jgi:hypothetical protein